MKKELINVLRIGDKHHCSIYAIDNRVNAPKILGRCVCVCVRVSGGRVGGGEVGGLGCRNKSKWVVNFARIRVYLLLSIWNLRVLETISALKTTSCFLLIYSRHSDRQRMMEKVTRSKRVRLIDC